MSTVLRRVHLLIALLIIVGIAAYATPAIADAAVGAPASVSAQFGDSTALVRWQPVPNAAGYRVSLIRLSDMGVMEQQLVPSSQLAFDAQGIWPNKQYAVAVEAVDASGTLGPATLSAPGQSVPISRTQYNGFLDTMGLPQGQINTDLWNEHIFYSNVPMRGSTFINDQIHGHIAAGCPVGTSCYGQQTITIQNARVPLDFSGGRTLTIHGEVDLKGDSHQWFGASVTPQILGPDRVLDEVDRFFMPVSMPQLELFTFQGHTNLLYAAGDGSQPQELASVPNPTGINNVRDDIVWRISSTHTQVVINGHVAFDLNWPAPLAFSHGYLSLFAEDYPNSGGTNGQPMCDDFPHDCAVWHLDNWGFDAPAGQVQPTSRAYYSDSCGPYAGAKNLSVSAVACGEQSTSGVGSARSYTVNVADASNLTSARVAFDAQRLESQGALKVSVDGGSEVDVPYIANDRNVYDYQSYTADVPASLLHIGSNTVRFRLASGNTAGDISIANVQLETLSSTPYSPPQLPNEPAPLSTWGGTPPTPTPSPSPSPTPPPTPSPTPQPIPINNVPCTVMLPSGAQTGACSGTFTPSK